MTKRRWRDTLKVLYDYHLDPRKYEELNQSKKDIESKFPKILKLFKDPLQNATNQSIETNLSAQTELLELIEDFHRQYQFVYDLYDHLRGRLSQTVNDAKEDKGYSTDTSSSGSDSETDESSKNTKQNSTDSAQESKIKDSSLAQMNRLCHKETSSLMSALESELSSLNFQLESLRVGKKVLGEPVTDLEKRYDHQILNLEKIENEMKEDGSMSEASIIKELMTQVSTMKLNVSCLKGGKDDCGDDVFSSHENLFNQVKQMKLELGSLQSKNTELESEISKKSREISDFLSQIGDLEKEVARMTLDLEKIQKEKESSKMKAKRLESELHDFSRMKRETEDQIVKKDHENRLLQTEVEGLRGKIANMENMVKEREDQILLLQKKLENDDEDVSSQIVALTTQINHLEREFEAKNELERQITIHKEYISKLNEEKECLQSRIPELEKKLEVRRDEFSQMQNEMSSQIMALSKEVSHLQQGMDMKSKLDEQIRCQYMEINEFRVEKERLQAKILELEISLTEKDDQIVGLERGVHFGGVEKSELSNQISCLKRELKVEKQQCQESMAQLEEHNKELISRVEDQEVILKQQDETLNKLRDDCKQVKGRLLQFTDRKMDEVVEEFRKNFEDKLRLLSRRLRVSEQLHTENLEQCKKLKEQCDDKHPAIEKRLLEFMSTSKVNLLNLSEKIEGLLKGMEKVVSDLERKQESYEQRMVRVFEDVQVAKNWVRWTMDEMRPKSYESQDSPFLPNAMDDKEQDKALEEQVRKLEARVNEEKGDKLRLIRGAYELQKKAAELERVVAEKDKEKIEAIRQLCMWIDYHKCRFDYLKDILVKIGKSNGRY